MTNSKYGKYISVVTAALTVLTGIALIICAAHILFTGAENPYSREKVNEYLSYLVIPASVTVVFIILGKVYDVLNNEKMYDGFKRSELEMLQGYAKRFELLKLDEKTQEAVTHERFRRTVIKAWFYPTSAFFAAFALVYLVFIAEFRVETLSSDVLRSIAVSLSLVSASISALIVCAYLSETSAKREREILLNAARAGYKPTPPKAAETAEKDAVKIKAIRYGILGIALLLIILGIFNGGMADVLSKAVKICTECIGLG